MAKNKNVVVACQQDELVSVLQLLKATNPRIGQVLERISQLDSEIRIKHLKKLACRNRDVNHISNLYFALGIRHCPDCDRLTDEQEILRNERGSLYGELQMLSYGIDPLKLIGAENGFASRRPTN